MDIDGYAITCIEDLRKRFYDIRVDFLSEDELNYELQIRQILLEDSVPMVRKRGNLRECLKKEKIEGSVLSINYELDSQLDYDVCIEKWLGVKEDLASGLVSPPPRGHAILLH